MLIIRYHFNNDFKKIIYNYGEYMKKTKEITAQLRDFFLNYSDLTDEKYRGCKQTVNWKLYTKGDSIYLALNKSNYKSYYRWNASAETFEEFQWYVWHELDALKRLPLIDDVEPIDLFNMIKTKII